MGTRITKFLTNKLAYNFGWMMIGQGLKLILQAAYFVIIARSLGVEQYGAFVAATALSQILSPFVGLGGGNLLIKNVARDPKHFPIYWGNLLFMTLVSGLAAIGLVIATARLILPGTIPWVVILFVGVAELVFGKVIEYAGSAFQSVECLNSTAQLQIVAMLARLIGIATLAVTLRHPVAQDWSIVYLLTTVFGAGLGFAWVTVKLGKPRLELGRIREELLEGFYFSTSLAAQNIYNDIDKTMLARLSTLDAVGIYAAAYRLIDVAFIPVRSLLFAVYGGFFRAGQEGIQGSIRYMKTHLPKAASYSFVAFFIILFCAPIVPRFLGHEYVRTVAALRWLALLPLLKSFHFFLADSLTCSGHQGLRSFIQVVIAIFNVLLNLWIIPAYSWRGAAWSSLASDCLLMVAMYLAVRFVSQKSLDDAIMMPSHL